MNARNYKTVEGPEGLRQALLKLQEECSVNPESAAQTHFILYTLAQQQSLIRIDPGFRISHYDLLGRSATIGVKEVIGQFLREKCKGQGHFEDISGKQMLDRNITSFLRADGEQGRMVSREGVATLAYAWQQLEQAVGARTAAKKAFGLFHQAEPGEKDARLAEGLRTKRGKSSH